MFLLVVSSSEIKQIPSFLDEDEEEGEDEDKVKKEDDMMEVDGKVVKCEPSTLDEPTQKLIKLIFDEDMFKGAMKDFDIGRFSLSLLM